jgi:hypothetical protein
MSIREIVFFGTRQVGMHHVEPKIPVRKTLEATVVVESEIPYVQNCIGSNMGSEFVDTLAYHGCR